jgi:predicted amidohydrolase YtcJ
VNSAKQEGVSSKVGRIEPGMLADVIMVDKNPFEMPITQVHATTVRMTFIGGEKVFDAASPQESQR